MYFRVLVRLRVVRKLLDRTQSISILPEERQCECNLDGQSFSFYFFYCAPRLCSHKHNPRGLAWLLPAAQPRGILGFQAASRIAQPSARPLESPDNPRLMFKP